DWSICRAGHAAVWEATMTMKSLGILRFSRLGGATFCTFMVLAGASLTGTAMAEATLTYAGYGGALQRAEEPAWIEPFMAANPGVTVVYDTVDYAKLKSMVESGNVEWDVANVAGDFGLTHDEPLLEKIDCNVVPCDELQLDKFPTTGYRVPN